MNDVAVGSIVEDRRTGVYMGRIIKELTETWKLNNNQFVKKTHIGKTWRAKVIDGSIIESIEEGQTWGKIIADIGNAWLLDSKRIAKKHTMGLKWQVKVPDVIQEEAKEEEAKEEEAKEEEAKEEEAPLIFPLGNAAIGKTVESISETLGKITADRGNTWLLDNGLTVQKNTMRREWQVQLPDVIQDPYKLDNDLLIFLLGDAAIGKTVESTSKTWGKIIADKGNAWLLDSKRIAKKNTMGQKWQVQVFDVIQEEAKEEGKKEEGKKEEQEEQEEAYILEDAPLIFPLGDAAIGKTVESIRSKKWGRIIRDLGKTWLLDNDRHVKKNTIGKTWQILGGTNVTVYPAKRVIHYIIDGHGGRTLETTIKERGILYNLYTQQGQPLYCPDANRVIAALKNPNISNIQPVIQYDHNYSKIYHDFQLSCDLPIIGSGDCFTGIYGNFKSGITRVEGDIYNEKIWDFDIHGVNNEYNLSLQPKVSEVIERIIKPDFLALAQCDTFEEAINKGYICSLHCLFCLNQMY